MSWHKKKKSSTPLVHAAKAHKATVHKVVKGRHAVRSYKRALSGTRIS